MAGNKNAVGNALTGSTGSGTFVGATSPTLVTPVLGTPTSGTLTNCTGLPVAGGGTGLASTTAYAVLCGGTTSTGALQSIAALGATGSRLTSNGAGALPSMKGGLTTFQAYCSTNLSLPNSTVTKITYDTELFDSGGYWDNATNYRYTPLIAGTYFVFVQATIGPNFAGGFDFEVYLRKNGTATHQTFNFSSGAYLGLATGAMFQLNGSTDYIDVACIQLAGSTKALLGGALYNYISAVLLEPT